MTTVIFSSPGDKPGWKPVYSVIAARHYGRWIFVRHHGLETWEMPAGHIEDGETPYEAACRELEEETGAFEYAVEAVALYSVDTGTGAGYGMLFFAEVYSLGEFTDKSEISEIKFSEEVLYPLTYPEIQPHFFREVFRYIQK